MKNKIKVQLSKLNIFIKSLTILKIIGIIVIIYLCILVFKEIKPQSYKEKYMNCLELGSDSRAHACIKLLNE